MCVCASRIRVLKFENSNPLELETLNKEVDIVEKNIKEIDEIIESKEPILFRYNSRP